MTLTNILDTLRLNRDFMSAVAAWERFPAQPARYAPLESSLDPRIWSALKRRGIEDLYTHQTTSIVAVLAGEHVVVSTATASGKSLCYTVPVFQRLLEDPSARALYLFPTKALNP